MYLELLNKIKLETSAFTTNRIVIQGEQYTPVATSSYLRLTQIPSEPTQATIGQNRIVRYFGILQLDYLQAKSDANANNIINNIIDHFNSVRFFELSDGNNITITMCWANQSITNNDRMITPIQLRYEYYK